MRVLLVWELLPEESKIFYFPDLPEAEYKHLVKCHGHVGNSDDSVPDSIISEWLCGWIAQQGDYLVSALGELVNPRAIKFDYPFTLIHCGFAL